MKKKLFALLLCALMLVSVIGVQVAAADGDTLGTEENDTPFWTVHSDVWAAEAGKTQTMSFTNFTDGATNWNNFLVVLQSTDSGHSAADVSGYSEYAVLRADNFGWGAGYGSAVLESNWNWDTFRDDMNGAQVTMTVVNYGDGYADVLLNIITSDGAEHFQNYKMITVSGDLYFCLTLEKAYLSGITAPVAGEISAEMLSEHAELVAEAEAKEALRGPVYYDAIGLGVGANDLSTPFWGDHSPDEQILPGQTLTYYFTNYSSKHRNWNNYLAVLLGIDGGYHEYSVTRADNWGWGAGYDGIATASSAWNWKTFKARNHGANVVLTIVNNDDGTADIFTTITSRNGDVNYQDYLGIAVDADDLYANLTVDNAFLDLLAVEKVGGRLGAEDNTTAWWTEFSDLWKVESGESISRRFTNYGGDDKYKNFVVILKSFEGATEYAVVRADNYGWSGALNTFANLADLGWTLNSNWNWDTFIDELAEAKVVLTVTNNGDDTADVVANITGHSGTEYYQTYEGISVDSDDLGFQLTVEGAHIVFEDSMIQVYENGEVSFYDMYYGVE